MSFDQFPLISQLVKVRVGLWPQCSALRKRKPTSALTGRRYSHGHRRTEAGARTSGWYPEGAVKSQPVGRGKAQGKRACDTSLLIWSKGWEKKCVITAEEDITNLVRVLRWSSLSCEFPEWKVQDPCIIIPTHTVISQQVGSCLCDKPFPHSFERSDGVFLAAVLFLNKTGCKVEPRTFILIRNMKTSPRKHFLV